MHGLQLAMTLGKWFMMAFRQPGQSEPIFIQVSVANNLMHN
jgi:hypothetical protein